MRDEGKKAAVVVIMLFKYNLKIIGDLNSIQGLSTSSSFEMNTRNRYIRTHTHNRIVRIARLISCRFFLHFTCYRFYLHCDVHNPGPHVVHTHTHTWRMRVSENLVKPICLHCALPRVEIETTNSWHFVEKRNKNGEKKNWNRMNTQLLMRVSGMMMHDVLSHQTRTTLLRHTERRRMCVDRNSIAFFFLHQLVLSIIATVWFRLLFDKVTPPIERMVALIPWPWNSMCVHGTKKWTRKKLAKIKSPNEFIFRLKFQSEKLMVIPVY